MIILSSCIFLLLFINISSAFDSCEQPLGMESGLITDSKIMEINPSVTNKASLRLNNNTACSNVNTVLIDLGRLMKITGFAFSSKKDTTATIGYAAFEKDLYFVNNNKDRSFLKKSHPFLPANRNEIFVIKTSHVNQSQKISIKYVFTLRYIKFHFAAPTCIQLEIYGCPEICSSQLPMPNMPSITTSTHTSLQFQYQHPITLTGLMVKNSLMGTTLTLNCLQQNNVSLVEKSQNISVPEKVTENITIWILNDLICHYFEIKASKTFQPSDISFLGCSTGCMVKLIKKSTNEVLSSFSYLDNRDVFKAEHSVLNILESAWAAQTNTSKEWLQVCFKSSVLVSAIALQSHGYWGFQRIRNYSLAYSYDEYTFYNYTENYITEKFPGPESRFGTKVNVLRDAVSVKCIRMRDLDCFTYNCIARWEVLGCLKGIPPVIKVDEIVISKNTHASLTCRINGQQGAKYHWENDNKKINESYYYVNTSISTRHTDFNHSYQINLYITNNISTLFTSRNDSNCTVIDQTNSVTCFMTYSCVAYYVEGDEKKEQATVSFTGFSNVGDPIVSVNSTNATSAQLSWSAPIIFGNFPVIAYNLKLVDDINETTIFQELHSNKDKHINFLLPYRNYSFSVYAVNRFNISSKTVVQRFRTKQAAPTAVSNLQVKAHSDVQMNLTWDLPQTTNGLLSFYFIEITKANGDTKKINTSKLFLSVDGLDSYTNYTVKVRASTKNKELLGPWETQNIRTKEGKPTAPQNISSYMKDGNFTIQWNGPHKMNGVLQTYKIILHGTKTYFPSFNDSRNLKTETTSIVVHNQFPGTNYTIHVIAVTGGGEGEAASNDFQTPYAKPNKANITNTQNTTMEQQQIFLNSIQQLTGPITFYEFAVSNQLDCFESPIFFKKIMYAEMQSTVSILIEKSEEIVQFGTKNFTLELIGKYMFCLRAVVNDTLRGDIGEVRIERKDLAVIKTLEPGSSTIVMYLPKVPNTVKFYVVIVSNLSLPIDPLLLADLRGFNESDPSKPYITGVFGKSRESFTVGDGETYNYPLKKRRSVRSMDRYENILNKQLQPATDYVMSFHAHEDESNFFSTTWKSGKTNELENPSIVPTEAAVNSGPTGTATIVGSIVAVVVLLSLVAVFFVIRRRRQQQHVKEKSLHLAPIGEDNNAMNMIEDMHENTLLTKVPPATVVVDPNHPPVKLVNLPKHWENLNKDSHHALTEEYKNLDSGQLYEWTGAVLPELKLKNRYANIVAYNHSRVKLQQPTSNGSDYVNASFVHGYSCDNMYIASQGPNATCLGDFWQLVWERNVSVVVMVTKLVEKNKKKCEQYWPDDGSQTYDNFVVSLSGVETFNDYVVRTFLVKEVDSKETRFIQQYHFLAWPDHGVPEFPSDLLNFQHKIRKDNPVETIQSPILVHCSAGVGRTGTFICIDNMLKLARERNMVDVFNYVNFMRSRRIHMVQTEDQYMLIYNALFEALTCGITAIPVSDFTIENQKLLRQNQNNTGKNGYQLQFDRLNVVTRQLTANDTKAAMKEENIMKNRSNILPRDISRVILATSVYDNEDSENYINAVYVNGYKRKNAYIATEHPLETNLYKYWKMILDKKVLTIVTLNSAYENNQTYDKFWPPNKDSCDFRNINVSSDGERVDGKMTTTNVRVSSNNNKESLQTCIVSYDGWRDYGTPINPKELIQLLTTVENKQMQSDSPIVVMCSDGAGRTGTFIAISILMDQLNMGQDIDVFQTVKKIRTTRPEFVSNCEQFQLCYKTIQTYLDCFSTYSNFSDQ